MGHYIVALKLVWLSVYSLVATFCVSQAPTRKKIGEMGKNFYPFIHSWLTQPRNGFLQLGVTDRIHLSPEGCRVPFILKLSPGASFKTGVGEKRKSQR